MMSDPRRIITRANPSTTPPGYEFDALDHATHEDGCPIGRGSTPLLAVRDLLSYFSQTTLEQIKADMQRAPGTDAVVKLMAHVPR
jgi:hypothetical protein